MSKRCILIFILGVVITTSTYAFFNFMQVPGQFMQMGQQMMQPKCECINENNDK